MKKKLNSAETHNVKISSIPAAQNTAVLIQRPWLGNSVGKATNLLATSKVAPARGKGHRGHANPVVFCMGTLLVTGRVLISQKSQAFWLSIPLWRPKKYKNEPMAPMESECRPQLW